MNVQPKSHLLHETAAFPIDQPVLPTVIEQTARQVFENFSEKLKATLNGRQDRALKLAAAGHVTYKSERIFTVRSENGKHSYLVNLARSFCTCPDSQQGHVCKHRLAAYLVEQSLKATPDVPVPADGTQPEPSAQPDPDLNEAQHDSLEKVRLLLNARSQFLRSVIIYAVLILDDQPLQVELLDLDGEVAFVRALPKIVKGDLVPQFPFPDKQSAASVLANSLTNIQIYR